MKVVAILVDSTPTLLVLPGSRRVSIERVREALGGEQVRLLNEGEMGWYFPDCEVGAIPPLRHWPNVEIVVDSTLCTEDEILFRGGNHKDAVRMPFKEWRALVKPRVESFSLPADWTGQDEVAA
jgi:Ala-tRNA(Pro) deacylase